MKDGDDDSARKCPTARIALDKRCAVAEAEAMDATQRLKRAEADVEALRARGGRPRLLGGAGCGGGATAIWIIPGGAEDRCARGFRALEASDGVCSPAVRCCGVEITRAWVRALPAPPRRWRASAAERRRCGRSYICFALQDAVVKGGGVGGGGSSSSVVRVRFRAGAASRRGVRGA